MEYNMSINLIFVEKYMLALFKVTKCEKNVIFKTNTQIALERQFSFLYEKTFSNLSE